MKVNNDQQALIKWGWLRALIYLVVVFGLAVLAQFLAPIIIQQLQTDNAANKDLLAFSISYGLLALLTVLFTFIIRKVIDRRDFVSLGFTWKNYSNEAGIGFFSAIAILGIGSLLLFALGYVGFVDVGLVADSLLIQTILMAVVAVVEELMFRGYLLNSLMQSTNKWIALSISAVVFAGFHISNPDISPLPVINILIAGFLLGLNYIYTKNLWYSIFLHFAWNYFQGPILGYEVSGLQMSTLFKQTVTGPELWTGGTFGFEGSLLCALLLIITILIFSFMFKKRYEGN